MPFTNQTEEKQIERAVLVGLSCPSFNTDQDADERTMDELRALAETAGAEAVAMTLQRRPAPDARYSTARRSSSIFSRSVRAPARASCRSSWRSTSTFCRVWQVWARR